MKIFSARFVSKLLALFALLSLCTPARADQLEAAVGQRVVVQVTADGTQPFTYQWYKDGTAISGATTSSLTLSSAIMGDAGSYTATVTNTMGSTTSDAAVLTMRAALTQPTITTHPAAQTVNVGTSVTFSVVATGTDTIKYQWTKNGALIAGATSASYTIASAATTDAGLYAVVVTNTVGTSSSPAVTSNSAQLTVNNVATPPTITSQPASATVTAPQSVTFSVTATSTSALTYQWRKGTTNISGATSASYTIASTVVGDTGSYSVVVTAGGLSTTSSAATLTVNAATTITQQPATLSLITGQAASFTVVATGSGTLTYQWKKGGNAISGATSATYTIASATSAHADTYTVTVTGTGGSVTSSAATLTVNPAPVATAPDGYATLVTGGAAGSAVTVTTATEFTDAVTADVARIINVSGMITLPAGTVAVKSHKTIQGVDKMAGIVGQLDLNGVNNVILRGLNISNTSGNGITLRNSTSSVFITHCSIYDCSGSLIEISGGSDFVTVSWSEFYYGAVTATTRKAVVIGTAGSETKPLHVTLHHNWWSNQCYQSMPVATYGYVHMFNNYFGTVNSLTGTSALGNTSGTISGANSQLLVERNNYNQVASPLSRQGTGLICAIGNGDTTGTAYSTRDSVFTPPYSYEMVLADDIDIAISFVGNDNGAGSTHPTSSSATINGPSAAVSPGSSFTLTAVPTGFTGASYQWRRNNVDISGATSSTYSVASMQSASAGTYTVVIGLPSSSSVVVSAPLDVALGTNTGGDGGSSSSSSGGGGVQAAASSSGGGGGAPGHVYLAGLALLGLVRLVSRRRAA